MNERRVLEALLGVYVGMVLVTTGVLISWEVGVTGLSVTALVVIGAVIAAVVTAAARRVDDLVDRVVSIPVVAVVVGVPLANLPYLILATEPESGMSFVALVGLLAVVPGIGIPLGGELIKSKRRRQQATEIVTVIVGDDDEDDSWLPEVTEKWVAAVGLTVFGLGILWVGIGLTLGFDSSRSTIFSSLGGLTTMVLFLADDSTEVVVTDSGLQVDQQFSHWDDLDGYRVTDDTIELVFSDWYRPTQRFEREEISDEDAFIKGLSEFLPQVDEAGEKIDETAGRHR